MNTEGWISESERKMIVQRFSRSSIWIYKSAVRRFLRLQKIILHPPRDQWERGSKMVGWLNGHWFLGFRFHGCHANSIRLYRSDAREFHANFGRINPKKNRPLIESDEDSDVHWLKTVFICVFIRVFQWRVFWNADATDEIRSTRIFTDLPIC